MAQEFAWCSCFFHEDWILNNVEYNGDEEKDLKPVEIQGESHSFRSFKTKIHSQVVKFPLQISVNPL